MCGLAILDEAVGFEYSRGKIAVLDRAGLEARVCECYAVVKKEYDRLLQAPAISYVNDRTDRKLGQGRK
jgi:hypothetical protein